MTRVEVEPLGQDRIGDAAWSLARAFVANPLNTAAFGPLQLQKNVAFYRMALHAMTGTKLVALVDDTVVGVVYRVEAPACRHSALDRLRMSPGLVRGVGLRSALRVVSWTGTWARFEPPGPHVYLGPIGVVPEFQRRRIGRPGGSIQRGARAGRSERLPGDRPPRKCRVLPAVRLRGRSRSGCPRRYQLLYGNEAAGRPAGQEHLALIHLTGGPVPAHRTRESGWFRWVPALY